MGNVVSYNTIYDAPHVGILGGGMSVFLFLFPFFLSRHLIFLFKGNNHIFEYNYIHDVCYEVSDSGAFYTGMSAVRYSKKRK